MTGICGVDQSGSGLLEWRAVINKIMNLWIA